MIGGRYDWWEGHALAGRDTRLVGTKTVTVSELVGMETLTEPEPPPSLPRVRWRAGGGSTVCILRHGHVARPLLVCGERGDEG